MLRRLLLLLALVVALPIVILTALFVTAWRNAPGAYASERAAAGPGSALDDLSRDRVAILLAVEDPGFYRHHGVDLRTPGGGWTTITQALAKRLLFEEFEPGPWNKTRQSIGALALDRSVSKRDQLALFVDIVPLGVDRGQPVQGLRAAARAYFDSDLSDLDGRRFLALVAMIVGPDAYHVRDMPERNAERVARIERLLAGSCRPAGFRDVLYVDCG
jgi:membrane peptidoglycan carboxypeptidase